MTKLNPTFTEEDMPYLEDVIKYIGELGVNSMTQDFIFFLTGAVFVAKRQGVKPNELAESIWSGFGLSAEDKAGGLN